MTAVSLDELIADQPFSYQATNNGLILIAYKGKTVTRLAGREARRFLARVDAAGEAAQQLAMAKATGHFKHGTEKTGKSSRKKR